MKKSYIEAEIEGLKGNIIQFGAQEFSSNSNVQLIDGEYYYEINLKPRSSSPGFDIVNDSTSYPATYNNSGLTRIRLKNTGNIDLKSATIYVPKEECKDITWNDWHDRDPACREGVLIPGAEIGYLPAGEYSPYTDVTSAFFYTKTELVTVLGDTLILYPYDHGPYGLLKPGAYTYLDGVSDQSKFRRSWDRSQFYLDLIID